MQLQCILLVRFPDLCSTSLISLAPTIAGTDEPHRELFSNAVVRIELIPW